LLPASAFALEAINSVISAVVLTAAFALIFKLLPDVKVAWRDVWVGAAVTALLFIVGTFLIGLYLGTSAVGSAYGAAGLPRDHRGLGVLLGADSPLRGGVHQGVGRSGAARPWRSSRRPCP
jgi:hypothetical protein